MSLTKPEQALLDEATWKVWIERGKQRDRQTARRTKILAGILFVLITLGIVLYSFWMK
jgi:hypothetical protein